VKHRTLGGVKQEALKIGNPYDRFHGWFSRLTGPRVDALAVLRVGPSDT